MAIQGKVRAAVTSTISFLAMLALAASAPDVAHAQQWKPVKPVEIVVGSAPGGSPDVMARLVQTIFQSSGLVASSAVINKPGGANTVGWAYLNQYSGNGHYIATYSPTLLGNRIMGITELSYTDFTPLNILAREYVVFGVRAESPITSLKDLIARLKKDSQSVSFAFATARGNHNHIVLGMFLKSIGIDPKVAKAVVYPGGGPALTAVLGGHVDVYVASPRSLLPLQQEGRARILAMSSAQRQPGALAELSTFRDQGVDAVFFTWRGFMGPRGLKAGEIGFWDATFSRLTQSEEWKKDTEKQFWNADFLLSAETRKHLDRENELVRGILTDLGLAKQ
ncbi:MAG: tripartite tricarboxylate transporter substrate binding protein [Betaproteobacteria bacterium]|nr:tripartite tricarboxylate transporter substrate binding protein [Betaproteobacteria bacterium]